MKSRAYACAPHSAVGTGTRGKEMDDAKNAARLVPKHYVELRNSHCAFQTSSITTTTTTTTTTEVTFTKTTEKRDGKTVFILTPSSDLAECPPDKCKCKHSCPGRCGDGGEKGKGKGGKSKGN
jgi:hypothetical protein